MRVIIFVSILCLTALIGKAQEMPIKTGGPATASPNTEAKAPVRSSDNSAKLATTATADNKLPLRTTGDAAKAATVLDAEKLPVRSSDPSPIAAPSGANQKAAVEKKTTLPSEKPAPSADANKAAATTDKPTAPARS